MNISFTAHRENGQKMILICSFILPTYFHLTHREDGNKLCLPVKHCIWEFIKVRVNLGKNWGLVGFFQGPQLGAKSVSSERIREILVNPQNEFFTRQRGCTSPTCQRSDLVTLCCLETRTGCQLLPAATMLSLFSISASSPFSLWV